MDPEDLSGAPEGVTDDALLSQDTGENTSDQIGDDAAAGAGEGQGDPPAPKRSAQDRIDELTRDKHAERRAREAVERRLAEYEARQQPKVEDPPEDAEPDPSQFHHGETDPAYIKALGAFSARQEFARLTQASQRQAQVQTVEQTWEQRQADFAKDKPDFAERIKSPDLPITPVMAEAIKTSDAGPSVAWHLANNPDDARRIAALHPRDQIREIGRLEARLEQPAASTTQTKTVSDAPAPHPLTRGQGGKFKVAADTNDFAAFEKQYGG